MANAPIKCRLRPFALVLSFIFGPLFILCPVVIGVAVLVNANLSIGIPVGLLCVGLSAFLLYHLNQNYQWVEIDGDVIRGKKFLTRQVVEQKVQDIVDIRPLHALARHDAVNAAITRVTGTANRGYEIRFRSGRRMGVVRGDMTDVDGFIQAVLDKRKWGAAEEKPTG